MTLTVERLEKILEKASKGDPEKERIVAESLETLDKLKDHAYDMHCIAGKNRHNDHEAATDLYTSTLAAAVDYTFMTAQIAMDAIFDYEGTEIEPGDKFKIVGGSNIHQVYDCEITYNHAVVKYRDDKVFVVDASDIVVVEKADGTKVEFPETYGMPKRCPIKCGKCLGEGLLHVDCRLAIKEYERVAYKPFECKNPFTADYMARIVQMLERNGIDTKEPAAHLTPIKCEAYKDLHRSIKYAESVFLPSEEIPKKHRDEIKKKFDGFEFYFKQIGK